MRAIKRGLSPVAIMIFILTAAVESAVSAQNIKVPFIPKPWEVNTERIYVQLQDGWRFFKEPLPANPTMHPEDGTADPVEFVLPDGSKHALGIPCEKPESEECDDSSWVSVTVPHSWADLGLVMDTFKGTVWYRKQVAVTPDMARRNATIHVWGAFYRSKVYVNGKFAGEHEGGFTSYELDVTGLLREGDNLIAVMVNNVNTPEDIVTVDWWNYGGLHREVFLEFANSPKVMSMHIVPRLDDSMKKADITFDVETPGAEGFDLAVTVYKLDGETAAPVGRVSGVATGKSSLTLTIDDPALWSPDSPSLYFAKAVISKNGTPIDGYGDMFGIRKFEIKGTAFYLNGKKTFLRGINRHDEFPTGNYPYGGRAASDEDRIRDFQLIKELGANAMRTGHYPNHPYNLYITDRLGIITIEQSGPDRGIDLNSDPIIEKYKQQTREMILRDRNHASIVMWSIGNEFGGDKFLKCIRALAEYAKSLDDHPITFTETPTQIVFRGYGSVDVVSRNEYIGWYDGVNNKQEMTPGELSDVMNKYLPQLLKSYAKANPGKPIVIMEMGAEAVTGRHSASAEVLDRGSEEYQAAVLRDQIEVMRKYDFMGGVFIWVFADFKTQLTGDTNQYTKHFNQKGVVSYNREKKAGFYELQKAYQEIAESEK